MFVAPPVDPRTDSGATRTRVRSSLALNSMAGRQRPPGRRSHGERPRPGPLSRMSGHRTFGSARRVGRSGATTDRHGTTPVDELACRQPYRIADGDTLSTSRPDGIRPAADRGACHAPPWLDAARSRPAVHRHACVAVADLRLPRVRARHAARARGRPRSWPLAGPARFYLGETNVVDGPLPARAPLVLAERAAGRHRPVPADPDRLPAWPTSSAPGAALLLDRSQSGVKRAFNIAQFGICGGRRARWSSMPSPNRAAHPGRGSGSPRSRRAAPRRPRGGPGRHRRSRCPAGRRSSRSCPR